MRRSALPALFSLAAVLLFAMTAVSQDAPVAPVRPPDGQLDPTKVIQHPVLFSSFHEPLPEQYVWTHDPAHQTDALQNTPRYFRVHFHVDSAPPVAILYLAGPRNAEVFVNGSEAERLAADPLSRIDPKVFWVDVTRLLRRGDNVMAIEADHGDRLVAKILPAPPGMVAPAILMTGPEWKATKDKSDGWESASFDDSGWPAVDAMGGIESNIDFFQWNQDAGMYMWPGYQGESPFLAHTFLPAEKVTDVYPGLGSFENVDALTSADEDPAQEFIVHQGPAHAQNEYVPTLTLDFGREVAGRVQVVSDSDAPLTVSIAYGESIDEAHDEPYLGVDVLHVTPHGTGLGPKSAFRYAQIRFLSGMPEMKFRAIRVEDIYYPVQYQGSFESSDKLLNEIWETGAYTTHLCMQNDIWDAPKRDRGRWMGDTDISGHVSDAVFADRFLVEDTLTRLIGPLPLHDAVNGIPGYSSYWFTELADFYKHEGDKEYIASMHDRILALLAFMDLDFDAENHFINHTHEWLYVDWSPGLNGISPETEKATTLEYVRAYRAGAWLLRELGDTANASHWEERADSLTKSSQAMDWTESTGSAGGSFGPRWETNAMAVISGVAKPDQYAGIWQNVLSHVGEKTYRPSVISPYYGAYVLDAMAEMGHRQAALDWIREYWGGMIHEGATSFWEAYDPSWPKDDPHVDLQADDTAGYRISLAHGWSSGPTYWLMEQVLGIQPTGPGFATVTIRPDLLDLEWAKGKEPTPHGMLTVSLTKEHGLTAMVDVPEGVTATVEFPVRAGTQQVLVNGKAERGRFVEGGKRIAVEVKAGRSEVREE
ncbi:MAG: alpha-L-rhamnosidase C-terminal domain-containing protein [Acidobacteriaceae bacterium]